MSTAAQTKLVPNEVLLTILTGPERGVAYKLVGQSITLGRAPENDVVLKDERSSRNHAQIERRGSDYWIINLESKLGVYLNDQHVQEAALRQGDQLRIGETTLRFGSLPSSPMSLVNATPSVPHLPLTKNSNIASQDQGWMPRPQRGRGRTKHNTDQGKGIIIVVVGVIIAIAFIANQKSASRKSLKLKDDATFDEQIEDTNQQNERQQQEIMSKGKDTQQYSEAQAFYLRGFREFREGNYGRAILNFEAALALYPNHPLAKRYLDRARIKDNELITQALERGEKDFQLQKYTHAFNEYRTVILLTNEPKNKYYQLAQKRIEQINLILMNNR